MFSLLSPETKEIMFSLLSPETKEIVFSLLSPETKEIMFSTSDPEWRLPKVKVPTQNKNVSKLKEGVKNPYFLPV